MTWNDIFEKDSPLFWTFEAEGQAHMLMVHEHGFLITKGTDPDPP